MPSSSSEVTTTTTLWGKKISLVDDNFDNYHSKDDDSFNGTTTTQHNNQEDCKDDSSSDDDDYEQNNKDADDEESFTDLMAQRLAALSMEEREAAIYDLHGVSDDIDETPDFVQQKLTEIQNELERIPDAEKRAYNMLLKEEEEDLRRIQSDEFLLSFLRADKFDATKAALRLTKNLNFKLKLFGREKLTKSITMNDLGPDGIELLELGWLGILPLRDQSGRRVIYLMPSRLKDLYFSAETRVSDLINMFTYKE